MPTIDSKVVEELDGSPSESLEFGVFSARMLVKCLWSERLAIADFLLTNGLAYPHASGRGAAVQNVAISKFKAVETKAAAAGPDDDWCSYDHALLTISYRTPTIDVPEVVGGILTSENIEPTVEALTLDYQKYQWDADPNGTELLPGEAPFRQMFGAEYVMVHHDILNDTIGVPDTGYNVHTAVGALVGKVNDATMTPSKIQGKSFGIATVLCKPYLAATKLTTTTFTYRFSIREEGWNKHWRADNSQFEEFYLAGSATPHKNFPEADFGTI